MFSTFVSVANDFQRFFNPRTTAGRRRILFVLIIVAVALISFRVTTTNDVSSTMINSVPQVNLVSLSSSTTGIASSVLGTVESSAAVVIRSEAAGRVVSVPVGLGQRVEAGSIVARLTNESEYANVLQAEGAYEAALAGAATSEISVSEAQNALLTANEQAKATLLRTHNAISDIFYNDLDPIFADPDNTYRTPGSLTGENAVAFRYLRAEYKYFTDAIPVLRTTIQALRVSDNIPAVITEVETMLARLERLTGTFQELITEADEDELYDPTAQTYLSQLAQIQTEITALDSSIVTTSAQIESATQSVRRAEIGGTNQTLSTANAQIKQALGRLRAAQAAYEKTIIRSPIAGTIASLPVAIGDTVSNGTEIAEVTNNQAYEVTVYLNQMERESLQVGDVVTFASGGEGRVSAIAPNLSRTTGKIEVRISSTASELFAGESVWVQLPVSERIDQTTTTTTEIPLNAVKFQGEQAVVFSVDENNTLVAQPIELGRPRGALIEVTNGLAALNHIVADARGLVAGTEVTVAP